MRALRGANAAAVIARLNPIIRGWAAYYRTVVSSERSPRWTLPVVAHLQVGQARTHPNKPKHWVDRPLLRHVQQGQAGPVGLRRPRQRRLPHQVRLDEDRPAPDGRRVASPDDPPWTTTGRHASGAGNRRSTRWGRHPAGTPARAMPAAAISCSCTPTTSHSPRGMGDSGSSWPGRRSADRRSPPTRNPAPTERSCRFTPRPRPLRPQDRAAQRPLRNLPRGHWACLSRMRGRLATSGSEGAPARQRAGLPAQASRHTRTVAGYFLPHVEPSKMSSSWAAALTVGAV